MNNTALHDVMSLGCICKVEIPGPAVTIFNLARNCQSVRGLATSLNFGGHAHIRTLSTYLHCNRLLKESRMSSSHAH